MTVEQKRDYIRAGEESYQRWADSLVADEEGRRLYEREAAKKELWLALVEARQAAGLTQAELAKRLGVSQAQVARIEKRGYDAYTLTTLRRYVQALGDEFELTVRVHRRDAATKPATPHPVQHS
jgi:DNA-binding XRE family transcriptional regulator